MTEFSQVYNYQAFTELYEGINSRMGRRFPLRRLGASGISLPGPDFSAVAGASTPADDQELLTKHVTELYYRGLYDPNFAMPVKFAGNYVTTQFVTGGLWGAPATGPIIQADVMVIGKLPGQEELQSRQNLTGPSGQELLRHVRGAGGEWSRWYVTNAVRHRHLDPAGGNLKPDWIKNCLPLLQMEVQQVRPQYILLLGTEAVAALFSAFPQRDVVGGKKKSITFKMAQASVQKVKIPLPDGTEYEAKALACYHPAFTLRAPEKTNELVASVNRFVRLVGGADIDRPTQSNFHLAVRTERQLTNLVDALIAQNRQTFAVDAEWHGAYPTESNAYVRTVQFAWDSGQAASVVLHNPGGGIGFEGGIESAVRQLNRLLKSTPERPTRIAGHYLNADMPWLISLGLDLRPEFDAPPELPGWRERGEPAPWDQTKFVGGFDTILAAHAIEETDEFKLEALLSRLLGMPRYDVKLQAWKKSYCAERKLKDEELEGYGECLHGRSLVELADGSKETIGRLVRRQYAGSVFGLRDGKKVLSRVTNWHRNEVGQKDWFRLRTTSTPTERHGLVGPRFTPDHKVVTSRGKVRVDALIVGVDSIVTDEPAMSADQLSVLLGSALGDGGFRIKSAKGVAFGFGQRKVKAQYVDWKAEVFAEHAPSSRNYSTGQRRYELPVSRQLYSILQRFPRQSAVGHSKRKLVITSELLNCLGALGLAVWYQDDGSLVRCGDSDKTYHNSRLYCRASDKEVSVVVAWLSAQFGEGINYNRKGGFFQISKSAFKAFHAAIRAYVHPAMAYKCPDSLGISVVPKTTASTTLFCELIEEVVKADVPADQYDAGTRYCLTTETGNFLTDVGFVSNCPDEILVGVPVGEPGDYGQLVEESYGCLSNGSLVQRSDGQWETIGSLVRRKYSGQVRAERNGRVVDALVKNWHRNAAGQKVWLKLRTASSMEGRWGLLGPEFTPDHEIVTSRGKIRVDAIKPGQDKVITEEREFSPDQLSVFLGSLLGDGGLTRKNGKGVGFHFSQRAEASSYADWKASAFEAYGPTPHNLDSGYRKYSLPFSRYFAMLSRRFPTHPPEIHAHRKAVITTDLLDNLGDLGLAVWYQDDGTLTEEASRIYCKLPKNEQELVVGWLTDKFGVGVTYNARSGFIQIAKVAFDRFHETIGDFIHPAMAYKSPSKRGQLVPIVQGEHLYADLITEVVACRPKAKRGSGIRYCLTTEAGNFLTKVGFVSNCNDADGTLRLMMLFNGTPGVAGRLDCDRFGNSSRQAFWTTMRAAPAFGEMHMSGITVDVPEADRLSQVYKTASERILGRLRDVIHWPTFNPNSTYHMREFLFGERYGKKNKTTGEAVIIRPVELGAITLGLTPYKSTGKRAKLWDQIVERREEHQYSPAADKEVLSVLAGQYEHLEPLKLLRDYRKVAHMTKTVLRPAIEEEDEIVEQGEQQAAATETASKKKKKKTKKIAATLQVDEEEKDYEGGIFKYILADGRVRSQFFQTKETGRASSARPALQNWSKTLEDFYKAIFDRYSEWLGVQYDYPLRSILRASPGCVLVDADYTGAELAIAAWLSGDRQMQEHVRRSSLDESDPNYFDLHSFIAAMSFRLTVPSGVLTNAKIASKLKLQAGMPFSEIFGLPVDHPLPPSKRALAITENGHLRNASKRVTFGKMYGQTPPSMARKIKEEGIDITVEEAAMIDGTIDELYPGLATLFAAAADRPRSPGFMRTCFGRYRRFFATSDRQTAGDQSRQAMNFPMQSHVADAMQRALDHLYWYRYENYRPDRTYKIVLQVHDAVVLEVPVSCLDWVVQEVIPTCLSERVPIDPTDFDGRPLGQTTYRLQAPPPDIYERWSVGLTNDDCDRLGINRAYAKA